MDKIKLFIIIAVLAMVGAAGFMLLRDGDKLPASPNGKQGAVETGTKAEPLTGTVQIDIRNSAYMLSSVTVKKGTTVTWTNRDAMEHDVAPNEPSELFQQGPMLARGEAYSVTFNEPGTYAYHCTPHPFMTGTVEVVD